MNFRLAVVILGCAFLANGKLYKRDLRERSLMEVAHVVKDVEGFQCILDTTPECQKKLYVRDLVDELKSIGNFLEKMKSIDWFDDGNPLEKLEEEEMHLLSKIGEFLGMLPQTWDEETKTHTTFGHIFDKCLEGLNALEFSTFDSFEKARDAAVQHIISCEADGFTTSVTEMTNADLTSATNVKNTVEKIVEIMAEVRDLNFGAIGMMFLGEDKYTEKQSWNDAFKVDAISPDNIGAAIDALFKKFGGGDNPPKDMKPDKRRLEVASKALSNKLSVARKNIMKSRQADLRRRISALLQHLEEDK